MLTEVIIVKTRIATKTGNNYSDMGALHAFISSVILRNYSIQAPFRYWTRQIRSLLWRNLYSSGKRLTVNKQADNQGNSLQWYGPRTEIKRVVWKRLCCGPRIGGRLFWEADIWDIPKWRHQPHTAHQSIWVLQKPCTIRQELLFPSYSWKA